MKRILVLFPNPWDEKQFRKPKYQGEYEFVFHGTDLFELPGVLKLMTFDAVGFVRDTAERFRGDVDGVLSTDPYVGAILAAAVARELDLPGNDPAAIIRALHKYYSRAAQRAAVPNATPPFALLPVDDIPDEGPLEFPFFVKPVKGTFSVYAGCVESTEELRSHMGFNAFQRLVLRRVTKPFNDLVEAYTDFEHDANHFIAEGLMKGKQVTVDGFVYEGEVEIMGVVDSVMFEGTSTFERFEYPSRHPNSVQERMFDLARDAIEAHGIRHGQFNIEFFYDRETGDLGIIEVNPRLSYQFGDLFEYVDGSNTYDVLLDLTLGRRPTFRRGEGEFKYSASFVGRTFHGKKLEAVPSDEDVERFQHDYEEATIKVYGKKGQSLKREMDALGSYRYAIINVAANTLLDLFAIHEDSIDKLPFEVE